MTTPMFSPEIKSNDGEGLVNRLAAQARTAVQTVPRDGSDLRKIADALRMAHLHLAELVSVVEGQVLKSLTDYEAELEEKSREENTRLANMGLPGANFHFEDGARPFRVTRKIRRIEALNRTAAAQPRKFVQKFISEYERATPAAIARAIERRTHQLQDAKAKTKGAGPTRDWRFRADRH